MATESEPFKLYLILHGLRKSNVSTLLRSCAAFDATPVLCGAVAQWGLSELRMADHGAAKFVQMLRFAKLADAVEHLRGLGVRICGVEIHPDAVAVDSVAPVPFRGSTAFLLGCEGDGLNAQQMALCEQFVYIEQYGNGTASLNVAIAGSIVMHRFASWARFRERAIDPKCPHKFLVEALSPEEQRTSEQAIHTRQARAAAAAAALNDDDDNNNNNNNEEDAVTSLQSLLANSDAD